ncbi:MAG: hypothetical protein ACFFBD_17215, partial [Candidatus Hodarchaeota archaeon]
MKNDSKDRSKRKQKNLGDFFSGDTAEAFQDANLENSSTTHAKPQKTTTRRLTKAKKLEMDEKSDIHYALFTLEQIASWTICPNIALQVISDDDTFFQDFNLLQAFQMRTSKSLLEHISPLSYIKSSNLPPTKLEPSSNPLIDELISFIYENAFITGKILYLKIDFQTKQLLSLAEWLPSLAEPQKRQLLEAKLQFTFLGLKTFYHLDSTQTQVFFLSRQQCLEERGAPLAPSDLVKILG